MKYSNELTVSLTDFHASNANAIIDAFYINHDSHELQLDHELAVAANLAADNKQLASAKVLWLLSHVASLYLKPDSLNDPLKPQIEWNDGRRSASIDDFTDLDIILFAEIVQVLNPSLFKARLADIVWLKTRKVQLAVTAIEAYQTKNLNFLSWIRGGRDAWRRACTLALMLGKTTESQRLQLEKALMAGFHFGLTERGFLSIEIAKLLFEKGMAFDCAETIATALSQQAEAYFQSSEYYHAGQHFEHNSEWFERAKVDTRAIAAKIRRADSIACEAKARTEGDQASYLGAHGLYEQAIQTYRDIPKKHRDEYGIDAIIDTLRKTMLQVGELGRAEMQKTSVPVDPERLEKIAAYAVEAVQGKEQIDALISFVQLQDITNFKKVRQSAIKDLNSSIAFKIMGGSQTVSSDGRVIAKNSNASSLDSSSAPSDAAITAQMIRSHTLHVGLSAHSLMAALLTLRVEHRLTLAFFSSMVRQSGMIPSDRVYLFSRALFEGYDGDFVVATHLLAPQIEHMVRVHLKQVGAITASLNRDGVEHENGLSTLIDLPEAVEVFGEDLVFEFNALLCDSNGPNLRNELAHGLLGTNQCQSPSAVYLWWLCLRLVITSWWSVNNVETSTTTN